MSFPYECTIDLTFASAEDAEMAQQTLQVDEELQPDKIIRTITIINDSDLHVVFQATEIRLLRAAVSSFYDMALVISKMLLEFK